MAIITLTMTVPERLITRMEPNVVTMISRVHLWLNVESAGMEPMLSPSPVGKLVQPSALKKDVLILRHGLTVRGLQIFLTIITKYAVKVFHILLLKALAVSIMQD